MKSIGWKNHNWLKIDDIFISIRDRGLKFSDGIFETILIRENKAILLKEHLNRLKRTAKILNIDFQLDEKFIVKIIKDGIKSLSLSNKEYGSIRINYSRGLNLERSIKISKENNKFNIENLWIEFHLIQLNFDSMSVIISKNERRNEFSLISNCKTFSYSQSIQALIEATNKNYDDSLLLNTKNELCCGTTFNLLLRRDNKWFTPNRDSGCLPGIMIDKLLKLNFVYEEKILPEFQTDDVLIAINSLSCRKIIKVDNLTLSSDFDPKFFWELLYN